jgi:hypothetical protein
MDATVKELWVKALRSGKYKQGFGKLRDFDSTYCCLGVLCEVAVKQGVIPEATQVEPGSKYGYLRALSYLPTQVREWAGLDAPNPAVANDKGITSGLGNHNDSGSHDFNSIADMIEASL